MPDDDQRESTFSAAFSHSKSVAAYQSLSYQPQASAGTQSGIGAPSYGQAGTLQSCVSLSTPWRGRERHATRRLRTDMRRRSQGAMLGFSGQRLAEHVGRHSPRARALTDQVILQVAEQGNVLKATHLKEAGLPLEELSNAVYDVLLEQDLPNFLELIKLDQDGGLDRIRDLWDAQKILWFFFLIGSIAFNVALLFFMNWTIFQSYMIDFWDNGHKLFQDVGAFHFAHGLFPKSLTAPSKKVEAAEAMAMSADIFKHIQDPRTRTEIVSVAAVIATFEVLWIFAYLLRAIRHIFVFVWGDTEYRCYMAMLHLMQHTLPTLSTFSSIKLFARVHPSLIYQEYYDCLQGSWFRKSSAGTVVSTAWFVATRLLCAVTALSAFAVKLLAVGLKLVSPHYGTIIRVASVFALLNNCMGCVLFEEVLQNRVFLFVFGGSDTEYRDDELALRNVYQCRVAKQIWTAYWDTGERFKAIVSLTTLDHYDLQRLLIEDIDFDQNDAGAVEEIDSPYDALSVSRAGCTWRSDVVDTGSFAPMRNADESVFPLGQSAKPTRSGDVPFFPTASKTSSREVRIVSRTEKEGVDEAALPLQRSDEDTA